MEAGPGTSPESLLDTYHAELLRMDEPRRRLAAEMSGLGIRYDLGEGHPLLGRRVPDLDLLAAIAALREHFLAG